MSSVKSGYIQYATSHNGDFKDLPIPKKDGCKFEINTIVDSGRDANGNLIGNVVGQDKIKINIEYPPLTDEELHSVLKIFDREQSGSFTIYVKFYDPRKRRKVIKQMYVGNRTFSPFLVGNPQVGIPMRWTGVVCNLIEV